VGYTERVENEIDRKRLEVLEQRDGSDELGAVLNVNAYSQELEGSQYEELRWSKDKKKNYGENEDEKQATGDFKRSLYKCVHVQ
jgi:hypothetical protein